MTEQEFDQEMEAVLEHAGGHFFMVQPCWFRYLGGDGDAAGVLGFILNLLRMKQSCPKDRQQLQRAGLWFLCPARAIEKKLGMSKGRRQRALKLLIQRGILRASYRRQRVLWVHVERKGLQKAKKGQWAGNEPTTAQHSSGPETSPPVGRKRAHSYTKNPSEKNTPSECWPAASGSGSASASGLGQILSEPENERVEFPDKRSGGVVSKNIDKKRGVQEGRNGERSGEREEKAREAESISPKRKPSPPHPSNNVDTSQFSDFTTPKRSGRPIPDICKEWVDQFHAARCRKSHRIIPLSKQSRFAWCRYFEGFRQRVSEERIQRALDYYGRNDIAKADGSLLVIHHPKQLEEWCLDWLENLDRKHQRKEGITDETVVVERVLPNGNTLNTTRRKA